MNTTWKSLKNEFGLLGTHNTIKHIKTSKVEKSCPYTITKWVGKNSQMYFAIDDFYVLLTIYCRLEVQLIEQ